MKLRNRESAYLTVYLALVFGVVLSLLLTLIEGAAIGAARLQAEIVADLGLDSVFAEYNRELLNQYELFFIDTSYGTKNSGVGMVEQRLEEYVSYNVNPKKDLPLVYFDKNWITFGSPHIEIERISYATDDNAMVWKVAAINYMKGILYEDVIQMTKDYINVIEENGYEATDVLSDLKEKQEELDKAIEEKMIEDYGEIREKKISTIQKIMDTANEYIGGALLHYAMPEDKDISDAVVTGGPYYSLRAENGLINKGIGLHDGAYEASGLAKETIDEFAYNEYLMLVCGSYLEPKQEGLLKYQLEYIIYGSESDSLNLKKAINTILGIRFGANTTSMFTGGKKDEVEAAALGFCSMIGLPEFTEPVAAFLISLMITIETYIDVKILLDGGKVPMFKSASDWNTSAWNLIRGNFSDGDKNTDGMSYKDYLRVLLAIAVKDDTKLARSLNIVEMDIRQTEGNEGFQIDRCAEYIKVQFGFYDGFGHDFLFSRSKCYE